MSTKGTKQHGRTQTTWRSTCRAAKRNGCEGWFGCLYPWDPKKRKHHTLKWKNHMTQLFYRMPLFGSLNKEEFVAYSQALCKMKRVHLSSLGQLCTRCTNQDSRCVDCEGDCRSMYHSNVPLGIPFWKHPQKIQENHVQQKIEKRHQWEANMSWEVNKNEQMTKGTTAVLSYLLHLLFSSLSYLMRSSYEKKHMLKKFSYTFFVCLFTSCTDFSQTAWATNKTLLLPLYWLFNRDDYNCLII